MKTVLAILGLLVAAPPVHAVDFSTGYLDITGDTTVETGETATIVAEWDFDTDVIIYAWLEDGTLLEMNEATGASGSAEYRFSSTTAGTYVIHFYILDPADVNNYISRNVTITVTDPAPVHRPHKNFRKCIKFWTHHIQINHRQGRNFSNWMWKWRRFHGTPETPSPVF